MNILKNVSFPAGLLNLVSVWYNNREAIIIHVHIGFDVHRQNPCAKNPPEVYRILRFAEGRAASDIFENYSAVETRLSDNTAKVC